MTTPVNSQHANRIRRFRIVPLLLLTLWVAVGAAAAGWIYGVFSRPSNEFASQVRLRPKHGTYGSVNLSAESMRAGKKDVTLVTITSPTSGPILVTLPDLELTVVKLNAQPGTDVDLASPSELLRGAT